MVAISCVLRDAQHFRVFSLSGPGGEGEIIQRFFDGIERYSPQIVSWNGGGFDLPVLHYRGMLHGVAAPPRYWDQGEGDYHDSRDFRGTTTSARYHSRHLDLMDFAGLYQPRAAAAPSTDLAKLAEAIPASSAWTVRRSGDLAGGPDRRDHATTADRRRQHLPRPASSACASISTPQRGRRKWKTVREALGHIDTARWKQFLAAWPQAEQRNASILNPLTEASPGIIGTILISLIVSRSRCRQGIGLGIISRPRWHRQLMVATTAAGRSASSLRRGRGFPRRGHRRGSDPFRGRGKMIPFRGTAKKRQFFAVAVGPVAGA